MTTRMCKVDPAVFAFVMVAIGSTLACDSGAPAPSNVVIKAPGAPGAADAAGPDSLHFEKSRNFDFDGDGAMEIIRVVASGAQWDSMNVYLTIHTAAAHQIWADSFTTMHYLGLDPDPDMTRAAIDSTIRNELNNILSDDAFTPTAGNFDDANIDLRSIYIVEIAKRRHNTDLWEEPTSDSIYEARVRSLGITEQEFKQFEDDVMKRPMFRYYIGGESSTGITWSNMLGRFVETSMCC